MSGRELEQVRLSLAEQDNEGKEEKPKRRPPTSWVSVTGQIHEETLQTRERAEGFKTPTRSRAPQRRQVEQDYVLGK